MAKYNSLNQNKWVNFQLDQDTYDYGTGQTVPIVQAIGGIYRAAQPTYTANDAVVAHFDSAGYLMCALKSGITVGGDLAVDVWSFRLSDGTDADAWVYSHDESLAAVSEVWQGFGGWDETADKFAAFPIGSDNAAAPTVAQGVPIMGEYNAAPLTYNDGDFAILQTDVSGHLMISGDFVYAEDAQHTDADEGAFILAVRNDTLASLSGTDGDYSPIQVNANGAVYCDVAEFNNNAITLGAGVVAGGTQRMTLASDDPAVTALEIIDDWDESDRAKVNPIVGQAGISANAGAMDVTTTRVTLATDDTHYGTVGVAADVDGVVHGQLRYIGDATFATQTAVEIMDDWDSTHGSAVVADGANIMLEAKDFDASALPNAVTEGQAVRPAATLSGIQFIMPVNEDGSKTPIATDGSETVATPDFLNVGAEYRASDTTYTDGWGTVLQSDINGHLKVRARGYDAGTDSQKVFEVSPVNQQFVSESLVDANNVSAATHHYPSSTGATMDGYGDISLTGSLADPDGTLTLTVEAMNDEDTAAGDWIDVTKAFYDAKNNTTGNASYTVTNGTLTFAIDADNFNYRYYRVAVVASGATNDVAVKARRKAI